MNWQAPGFGDERAVGGGGGGGGDDVGGGGRARGSVSGCARGGGLVVPIATATLRKTCVGGAVQDEGGGSHCR